jgi:hypothetical protein
VGSASDKIRRFGKFQLLLTMINNDSNLYLDYPCNLHSQNIIIDEFSMVGFCTFVRSS